MRVSHFAKIEVIAPPADYDPLSGEDHDSILRTVGMAQNISIDDNFGSRAENTIGTPLPVLAPGYQQTTINIEKATVDGADFRNLGAFNPLWAHVGATYRDDRVNVGIAGSSADAFTDGMYPFMFVARVRNKVSDSTTESNIQRDNLPTPLGDTETGQESTARKNSFGVYACVLTSASISATSSQAVIMDRVNAIARPVDGTWLSNEIKTAFSQNQGAEDLKNGMNQVIYNVVYGYES